jgi:hypothetical protein
MRVVGQDATPDKYGIYSSWNDGLLVEGNRVSGGYNSGIYTSNSARNYIIRSNEVFDVGGNGIHNNGDLGAGSPGINYNALIERNVIYNVGFGIGGQAISCDAVQDSVIQNNLLYDIHAKGISLYVTNGAQGSRRNLVINNTVICVGSGAPMRLNHNSSSNTVLNNIFIARSSIDAWTDSEESGLTGSFFDYNVTFGVPKVGGVKRNDWHTTYGFDLNSIKITDPTVLFVDMSANDYHLKSTAPAVDAGTSTNAPTNDFDGLTRPSGAGYDIGAFEYQNGAPGVPAAPSDLEVTHVTATQISLSWTDNSTDETGFLLERRIGNGAWIQIASLGTNVTGYADSGLTAGTLYSYRVRSTNGSGSSAYSNTATTTTLAPPAAPSGLSASATSSDSVTLTWSDNSNNETGFLIERRIGSGSYVQIATVGAGVESYIDTNVTQSTSYTYRIRATNGVGHSSYSNTASVQTPLSPPVAPSGLTATANSSQEVELLWNDNSNNESGFIIERRIGSGAFVVIATVGANVTSYIDGTVSAGTDYAYRVRATNSGGHSGYSNIAALRTPDTTHPLASLLALNLMTGGSDPYTFSVGYSDNVAIDTSFLDDNDILVTGPNGFSQLARFVSFSGSGGHITATYALDAPAGGWGTQQIGAYTASMRVGQVRDTSGNSVRAGPLGNFLVAPPEHAGNDLETARVIGLIRPGTIRVAEDWVGWLDRNDFYRITIDQPLRLSVKLYNMSDNADLMVLDSAGQRLAYAKNLGNASESITIDLTPGTYYVRVLYLGNAGTAYRLRFEGIAPTASINPLDDATDLGTIGTGTIRAAEDEVSTSNRNDYYRFEVTQPTRVAFKLYNMTDDADLMILDSQGNRIAYSYRPGSSAETLTLDLPAGTYFVRVLFVNGLDHTSYRLRLEGLAV